MRPGKFPFSVYWKYATWRAFFRTLQFEIFELLWWKSLGKVKAYRKLKSWCFSPSIPFVTDCSWPYNMYHVPFYRILSALQVFLLCISIKFHVHKAVNNCYLRLRVCVFVSRPYCFIRKGVGPWMLIVVVDFTN